MPFQLYLINANLTKYLSLFRKDFVLSKSTLERSYFSEWLVEYSSLSVSLKTKQTNKKISDILFKAQMYIYKHLKTDNSYLYEGEATSRIGVRRAMRLIDHVIPTHSNSNLDSSPPPWAGTCQTLQTFHCRNIYLKF